MPLSVEIKKVTIADIDTLLNLSRKTFFDAFAHLNNAADMESYAANAFIKQRFEEELRNPGSEFYFALFEGNIAGYIKLNYNTAQTELQDPAALEIERIYILNEYQGKQIGKQLIDFAIDTAISQKLSYVWLGVWEHNTKAISFYKNKGFEQFGSHPFMLGSDEQTDIMMKLAL
ncbi:GNAT family N-acetyltransferase [Mucilaginibacter rigui]|uniref:GNAT family N-acetyltransferase n=1 Tax=Mucilaginibacter rigui TaxID=534635 RepID=A0ABR7X2K5_9SPHI|nr:GNAT family N-acetyltransferase [Mucilaginibacter rigui]MBD1384816.1 GNAT family N-acetyltransferase [Mucilaginibacter rigui]